MGLILTLILGGLVGWLASIVTKRDAEQGIVENVVVGVVGAIIGSFLYSLITGDGNPDFLITLEAGDLLSAFVGAVLLCLALNYFKGKRRTFRR